MKLKGERNKGRDTGKPGLGELQRGSPESPLWAVYFNRGGHDELEVLVVEGNVLLVV